MSTQTNVKAKTTAESAQQKRKELVAAIDAATKEYYEWRPILDAAEAGKGIEFIRHDNKWKLGLQLGFTDPVTNYRIKKDTVRINGFEVVGPTFTPPKKGDLYYIASPASKRFYLHGFWENNETCVDMLNRGIVFLEKDDAASYAQAMLGINPRGAE